MKLIKCFNKNLLCNLNGYFVIQMYSGYVLVCKITPSNEIDDIVKEGFTIRFDGITFFTYSPTIYLEDINFLYQITEKNYKELISKIYIHERRKIFQINEFYNNILQRDSQYKIKKKKYFIYKNNICKLLCKPYGRNVYEAYYYQFRNRDYKKPLLVSQNCTTTFDFSEETPIMITKKEYFDFYNIVISYEKNKINDIIKYLTKLRTM